MTPFILRIILSFFMIAMMVICGLVVCIPPSCVEGYMVGFTFIIVTIVLWRLFDNVVKDS